MFDLHNLLDLNRLNYFYHSEHTQKKILMDPQNMYQYDIQASNDVAGEVQIIRTSAHAVFP